MDTSNSFNSVNNLNGNKNESNLQLFNGTTIPKIKNSKSIVYEINNETSMDTNKQNGHKHDTNNDDHLIQFNSNTNNTNNTNNNSNTNDEDEKYQTNTNNYQTVINDEQNQNHEIDFDEFHDNELNESAFHSKWISNKLIHY